MPDPAPPTPAAPWWKKLAALAISLSFCLLILEIYARLTYQGQWPLPRSAFRPPGVFSARLKPNLEVDLPLADGPIYHVSTNERGFRGPLVSSLASERLKVVSIGDSFMFSWGLPLEQHAMARFADGYRAAHPERGLSHAFISSPAWDPKDYYYAYLTEVVPTKVDLVVLGFFAGNDILPSDAPRWLDPAEARAVTELPPEPQRPLLRFPEWGRAQVSSSLLAAKIGLKFGAKPASFARFDRDVAAQEKLWDTTYFYLDALASAVRKNGAELVIIAYPSSIQVNAGRALDDAGLDHRMPDRLLGAFCAKRGIELVTLLDELEANNQKLDLYWPKDRHMTAHGQEVVAKVLAAKLTPVVDRVWQKTSR